MDDYQRGVWAAYDAARGTNADLCTTPSRAYQLMLEAINKLRHAAPEQKVPAMTDPSPRMREQMLDLVVSAIRNTEVGHPLAPGERQTLCDALADGINFDPTDDSAATIYDALHAIANAAVAAADLTSQAAEIERLRADCVKLIDNEVVAHCEGCGAWLLLDDDYVSDPDGVTGCWAAMTDLPSKRERPCYTYRVGKPDARAALNGESHE